jgi:hypothetical protein
MGGSVILTTHLFDTPTRRCVLAKIFQYCQILETGKSPECVYQSKPPRFRTLKFPSCDPTLGNSHSQSKSSKNSGDPEAARPACQNIDLDLGRLCDICREFRLELSAPHPDTKDQDNTLSLTVRFCCFCWHDFLRTRGRIAHTELEEVSSLLRPLLNLPILPVP